MAVYTFTFVFSPWVCEEIVWLLHMVKSSKNPVARTEKYRCKDTPMFVTLNVAPKADKFMRTGGTAVHHLTFIHRFMLLLVCKAVTGYSAYLYALLCVLGLVAQPPLLKDPFCQWCNQGNETHFPDTRQLHLYSRGPGIILRGIPHGLKGFQGILTKQG